VLLVRKDLRLAHGHAEIDVRDASRFGYGLENDASEEERAREIRRGREAFVEIADVASLTGYGYAFLVVCARCGVITGGKVCSVSREREGESEGE
jgi:hypothetical protein